MKKAQLSVELLIVLTFILLIIILLMNAAISQKRTSNEVLTLTEARLIADDAARAINSVYLAQNNASTRMSLPYSLKNGPDFTMTVYSKSVAVRYFTDDWHIVSQPIFPTNINGTTQLQVGAGEVLIRNINGGVYFDHI